MTEEEIEGSGTGDSDLFVDEDDDDTGEASEGLLFVDDEDDVGGEQSEGTGTVDAALARRVDELEAELASVKDELAQANERALRRSADLENARRRHMREKADVEKFAGESLLKDFAPILDDLSRALHHASGTTDPSDPLLQGVDMVARKFQQTLERRGVVLVESVGKPFDPQLHEAIQQVADPSVPHNTVVQEFQRGYLLHDRLLRPALVVVAQGGPPGPKTSGSHPSAAGTSADGNGDAVPSAEASSQDGGPDVAGSGSGEPDPTGEDV